MVKALLARGHHNITAIQRQDSPNTAIEGCTIARVDYSKPSTIVSALQDNHIDALIITMNARVPIETDQMLYRAAADANVSFVLPNDWGLDYENEDLAKGVLIGTAKRTNHAYLNGLVKEKASEGAKFGWIGVCCGFWYEWSLSVPATWGFDFDTKTMTFVDDGKVKQNTSTFGTVGRSVAALLSLPVTKEGNGACLEDYRNGVIYVSSFCLSQREMFDSVLRVTGDKESDWTINHEGHQERYDAGLAEIQAGIPSGFAKCMYTRVMFPDEGGRFEKTRQLANKALGLPEDDLDEATKRAVAGAAEMKARLQKYSARKTGEA